MEPDTTSVVSLSKIQLPYKDGLRSAADFLVARTLQNRKSHCDHSCKSGEGESGGCTGCSTSGKDELALGEPQRIDDVDGGLLEVTFKGGRAALYQNGSRIRVALSDLVVVPVEQGIDAGFVSAMGHVAQNKLRNTYNRKRPQISIMRTATEAEIGTFNKNRDEEQDILRRTRELVRLHKLDMKITDAEWQLDRQRLTVYFTAPARVDFRDLVKDLARIFHTRIELRQIPAREEAKRLGGIGPCGLELCCSSFLTEFAPITLDHAKAQQLAGNVSKLSGMCGRLKCCLLYEIDNYVSALKNYPPLDSIIELPEGRGKMIKVDIFRDVVTLYVEGKGLQSISFEELSELRRNGKVHAAETHHAETGLNSAINEYFHKGHSQSNGSNGYH